MLHRTWWWPLIDWLCLLAAVLAMIVMLGGCSAQAQLASALNVAAVPIDASYSATADACGTLQEQLVVQVEEGKRPRAEVQPILDRVRARCHRLVAGYELLRQLHEKALALVRSGALQEAEDTARQLGAQWAAFMREEVADGTARGAQ